MYYEETWIGDSLFWRSSPNGKWIELTIADYKTKVRQLEQQVKSVDLADVGKRSFVATDVHGVLFHDGFADNLEDAIQQTYNAIGDKATTLNFRWIR